jgi:tetratricopeptide (TPR) repeat protein
MRRLDIHIRVMMLCFVTVSAAYGQDAGTESIFLEAGLGARAQGFGQAFTALANDGSAIIWNPAGLDYVPQSNISVYHATLFGGAYSNFATFAYPFVSFGTIGLGVARVAVSGIDETNGDGLLVGPATWSQYEFYLSYGKKLPWFGLSLGTTFKAVRLASYFEGGTSSDIGTGMDVGLLYRPEFESPALRDLSFGLSVQNVVQPSIRQNDTRDTYPWSAKFGIAKHFLFGDDQVRRLTLTTDITKGQFRPVSLHVGSEFMFHKFVVARAGFDNGTFAVGLGTEFTQYQKYHVDYALNLGSQAGQSFHRVTLTVHFGKTIEEQIQIAKNRRLEEDQRLITRTAEANRQKALKEHRAVGTDLFRQGKLLPALVEWEQVSALDPANEEAKMFLDSINVLMDQQLATQLEDTARSVRITENDKVVRDFFKQGYGNVQKGDYIAALNDFQNALDRSPNNPEVLKAMAETRDLLDKRIGSFIARARASAAANNFSEALKLLSEARSLDPTNQTVQREIDTELKRINNRLTFLESTRNGLDAYQRQDYQAAMELFEKALLLEPNNATVREYHKKAIVRAFATFKTLEGSSEKMYLQGVDLYVEGKYEQAIKIWNQILEVDPYNKRVLNAVEKAEEQMRQQQQLLRPKK